MCRQSSWLYNGHGGNGDGGSNASNDGHCNCDGGGSMLMITIHSKAIMTMMGYMIMTGRSRFYVIY